MDDSAKTLAADLAALVNAGQGNLTSLALNAGVQLAAPAARPGIGAAVGIGRLKPDGGGSSSAGIAFPLTETSYAARTWHTPREISTTDGIFTFVVEDLHTVTMADNNGATGNLIFAEPA